jgi:DNA (cytosine-5)-methyltransferase 1
MIAFDEAKRNAQDGGLFRHDFVNRPVPLTRKIVAEGAINGSEIFTFIDLFSGMGGTRVGFEQACRDGNLAARCVFSSDIKDYAVRAYERNFGAAEKVHGDITTIPPESLPEFDYLLAGFPCQPFSSAGKRKGFLDERGGLFFAIVHILQAKNPIGFLLENVEGLATHNQGLTLKKIIFELENLGYHVSWNILDASEFGVPQQRRRIYIVGHHARQIDLTNFEKRAVSVAQIVQHDAPITPTPFTKLLAEKFKPEQLHGKAIKDKRGGKNNIHSWDLELKGEVSKEQRELLGLILKQRRYKKWAVQKGITWMDGMPLTLSEIATFFQHPQLKELLEDLTRKGYLTFEHPREVVLKNGVTSREPALDVPPGYNIVAGKLSFSIAKILDPKGIAPTLVATEYGKIALSLPHGVRKLTVREGLRLSGYPESYCLDNLSYRDAFDLIGNTVMPPVIQAIAKRLIA